jgi:hypothetical protein
MRFLNLFKSSSNNNGHHKRENNNKENNDPRIVGHPILLTGENGQQRKSVGFLETNWSNFKMF